MTLTPENVVKLKEFFPVRAHEFLNGNTYLTEEAITNRLDEVDPSWGFERLELRREDNVITAVFRMTVCGVSRDGVGMASVQLSKEKDREVNEAEKSAATDALKRCARLFGIGRYILEIPKDVKDLRALNNWLAKQANGNVTELNDQPPQNAPNSNDKADLSAKAAGDYEPQATTPERAKAALNGHGHKDGQKKGSETPLEWFANSVTVKKDRNSKPYLIYNCQEGQATGRGRDPLRKAGYQCEDWTVEGLTYELTPPAVVVVQKNGEYHNVIDVQTTAKMEF